MPPYIPRKRLRQESPEKSDAVPKKKTKAEAPAVAPARKATLFDDLDATSSPKSKGKAREKLVESSDDSDSLTSLSDADFADLSAAITSTTQPKSGNASADEEEDDDVEFEDVAYSTTLAPQGAAGLEKGALELTLSHIPNATYADFGDKRGPSKNERRIRDATHCMHVQFLMWHNAIRNTWLCDPLVQGIMLSHLPQGMWDEIDRFRRNSGLAPQESIPQQSNKKGSKGKGKSNVKTKAESSRGDWSKAAQRLEKSAVNMSFGDPLFRLLKALSSWWRKRFRITAPGLRKIGYMQTRRSTNLIKGYRAGGTNPHRYGERISGLAWFRLRAQECTGSRDVGAQLFTALLRAIGVETRMVASLQPVGFSFNSLEDAGPERRDPNEDTAKAKTPDSVPVTTNGKTGKSKQQSEEEDSDLYLSDDIVPMIDVPPLRARKKASSVKFDSDLEYPHYWAEVLSPATQKYIPVDALVRNLVGTNRDFVESFEPRGGQAERARQVIAYVVGFSDDGTAKDVTVRYLKRQTLPGRTKGSRYPIQKVPLYNKNGRVKRYDQFDWFKLVLRGYVRGDENHPLTDIDWDEDATDLKPAEKKESLPGEDTLQFYKQSKEFVLERHLKREEALLPTAEPVRMFRLKSKSGVGDEEPVYLRKDVVQVKSEETWHKQGRAPLSGAKPLKMAPYRAATTNRRRELAEAEAQAGHKVLQPLYGFDQTEWIIPPPIENGIIPKNQYGNIDLFAEHMLPKGSAHIPFRGAVRVCKRLEIDFAEAVVDFEFGHRMAVPVIQGVVIAEEYHDHVMEELAKDEAEKKRKEDEKRQKLVLATWRRYLMGLRIRERIRKEYGDADDSYNVFGHSRDQGETQPAEPVNAEEMAGGFLPDGDDEDGLIEPSTGQASSFFFPVGGDDDEDEDDEDDDALIVDHGAS
ncbi:Rad4 transglutaminase-like domain-domain-containing protein [Coniella lustricola]|uniref:Rad4 transglutaminase-like domain-domain-containing protein n=1 Tax=Coniella lustricola TaxID=2025994 RepID=A0A2T3AKJ5_9PEZI|nr:Rad4 transglutaminase-like domain-domain-containing protein [Coniella lustricola]